MRPTTLAVVVGVIAVLVLLAAIFYGRFVL
jgi:hypothetical protein